MRNAAVLLLALVLAGCSSSDDGGDAERPGSPAVYERIDGLTDCTAIQGEFDTAYGTQQAAEAGSAEAEAATAYMQAAQDRLEELGCV